MPAERLLAETCLKPFNLLAGPPTLQRGMTGPLTNLYRDYNLYILNLQGERS
jgi:hypothetical protein